jgi:oxygen-independent coproporphyrinogen-3 oxidase
MDSHLHLKRFGLFDARVPRYTSYPTAPHFGTTVGVANFTAWVAAIPAGASISLYLHVPFCRRLCWFCACRTQGTSTDLPVRAYVQTLKQELALLKPHLAPGIKLSRLHWGGGTPTLIPAELMKRLADAIFEVLTLAEAAEFSVEIDPNEIDAARLDALTACGMNRASVGVQDFDPDVQQAIGRVQSYELTKRVVDMVRARGIDSLNADILYGLPHQTKARIAESAQKLLTLSPDRIALYGYAHVPWMSRRQQMIPSEAMPTPEERLELFELAQWLFTWDGYRQIGIDHFARPQDGLAIAQNAGRLRRNFQGYTDDSASVLIGLGASSISRFPQGFAQNISGTADYTKAIHAGQFATHRGHAFGGEDLLRARIVEALMCDFQVNRAELTQNYDASPTRIAALLQGVKDQFGEVLKLDETGLFIPQSARPLTRIIARAFDTYDTEKTQHSTAI